MSLRNDASSAPCGETEFLRGGDAFILAGRQHFHIGLQLDKASRIVADTKGELT